MANRRDYPVALGALRGVILAASLCLGDCQSSGPQDITGSISGASEIRRSMEEWGRQYDHKAGATAKTHTKSNLD
jgi:hypothetical protein